jgi:hypothetical protein
MSCDCGTRFCSHDEHYRPKLAPITVVEYDSLMAALVNIVGRYGLEEVRDALKVMNNKAHVSDHYIGLFAILSCPQF